ncbi:hypothetical protein FQA39_LY06027 [Lamprigera yunnana]|nr:hypothetical protein FQA39_LY06027 [Lamprigera yunnana]
MFREIDPQGGVEIIRKLLRQVLKIEKRDPIFQFPSNLFSFQEDFEDSINGGSYKQINSNIAHAEGCLLKARVDSKTEITVTELYAKLKSLKKSILAKVQNFEESFTVLPTGKGDIGDVEIKTFSSMKVIPQAV